MITARMCRLILLIVGVALLVIALVGCAQFSAPSWPVDYIPILTDQFPDPAGDEIVPAGSYPSVDVTNLALGVFEDYLYIRVDYSAPIPTTAQDVAGIWPAPADSVMDHSFVLNLDVDAGPGFDIDVAFHCKLRYGEGYTIYILNTVIPASLDLLEGIGELGEGGSGFDFLLVRYDVSRLGSLFPRGATVSANFWSRAEDIDAEGGQPGDHEAIDPVGVGFWTIPN